MQKADESLLGQLHGQLAKEFLRRIKEGGASPSDLNAARQFLKDNGISCDAESSGPMQDLMANMPEFSEFDQ